MADIWKDPMVQEALKDGRSADDIQVIACPKCGEWSYWNEGSHFSCRFCNQTWYVYGPDNDHFENVSLSDTVTVTTDGYDNQTLANPRDGQG